MTAILRTLALRLALCAVVAWAMWRSGLGAFTVVVAGLVGVALAKPLLDLASAVRHQMRRANWREVEGRHYAFRGAAVRVQTDEQHRRWVRLADVRRAVGYTASDAALQVTYPSGFRRIGRPAEPHLSDEALLAHLAKERTPEAIRMQQWVKREIVFPARRERERLGIRSAPPDAPASE